MATKPTLPTLVNTGNIQAQLTTINNGYRQIENEFEKMLSREDNSLPNHMLDALDMDGNKVINVADGTEGADAVNKSQLDTKENSLGTPAENGMFLASLTSGYRYWAKGASGGTAPISTNDFEYIDFDITPTITSDVGRLFWNDVDGTLDLGLKGGNVTLHIGQKQLIRIVNKTTTNLLAANYQCVKISGAQGQRPKVALAQSNNDANSADTIGLVNENINDNQVGFVCTSGIITNINTTGSLQSETWLDGDVLYLSGTVAGALTKVKPQAPIHTVIVGFVIYAHANQGKIFVKVDNGYELDELHNVLISTPTNAQVLSYESATGLWKNTTPAATVGTTAFAATFNNSGFGVASGTTFDGSVARTISYNTLGAAPLASPTFTGTPVLTTTTTVGAAGPVVGYRDVPVTISNAATTFALADAGKAFGKDDGTAYTYTIPANGTVAFPVGTVITVFNNNATSNITVAITTDTLRLAGTTTTGSRTVAPFALCTLFKVSSTVWMASGAGVT